MQLRENPESFGAKETFDTDMLAGKRRRRLGEFMGKSKRKTTGRPNTANFMQKTRGGSERVAQRLRRGTASTTNLMAPLKGCKLL
jgi:hypothetical protein